MASLIAVVSVVVSTTPLRLTDTRTDDESEKAGPAKMNSVKPAVRNEAAFVASAMTS